MLSVTVGMDAIEIKSVDEIIAYIGLVILVSAAGAFISIIISLAL